MQIQMVAAAQKQDAIIRQTMVDMGLSPAEIFSDGWGPAAAKVPASEYSIQIVGSITGAQLVGLMALEIVTIEGNSLTLANGYMTSSIEDDQPIIDLTFG